MKIVLIFISISIIVAILICKAMSLLLDRND